MNIFPDSEEQDVVRSFLLTLPDGTKLGPYDSLEELDESINQFKIDNGIE